MLIESKFGKKTEPVFLVVVYQYESQGLKDIREDDFFAYWWPQGKRWFVNNRDHGKKHLELISKAKEQLWKTMEEEN